MIGAIYVRFSTSEYIHLCRDIEVEMGTNGVYQFIGSLMSGLRQYSACSKGSRPRRWMLLFAPQSFEAVP
jgi:hypothetical protein